MDNIAAINERTLRRQAAWTAGIALIVMTLAAMFAYGYVHGSLVQPGDAASTLTGIQSSPMLFRAEIFGWLVILVCDILVAWAFYNVLKPVNESLALLGAWFRLAYAVLLGVAISHLIAALLLANRTDGLLDIAQLRALTMLHVEAFDMVWSIGLIVFGGHLAIVGCLAYKSGSIPNVFGILLLIASAGYIVIHLGNAFLPQFERIVGIIETVCYAPMIAGELGFGIWLLVRGRNIRENG